MGSGTTEVGVLMQFIPVGTAGAADYFEVTDIQLEEGQVAAPVFERRHYAFEEHLCHRYYRELVPEGIYSFLQHGGVAESTTVCNFAMFLTVPMRVVPTLSTSGNLRLYSAAGVAITSAALNAYQTKHAPVVAFTVASGLTAGGAYAVGANNDVTARIKFNAEIS